MKLRRNSTHDSRSRQRQSASSESTPKTSGFSYRASRSEEELNLGRRADKERRPPTPFHTGRFWLQRFGLIILLIAIIASAVNLLNLSTTAEILPLSSNDPAQALFNKPAYQAAANHLLARSIWNQNKVTVDTGQISRQLLAQFPELATVSVTIPLLTHRPIIYIEPAQPVIIIQSPTEGSFVLNTNGKALLKNTANPLIAGQSALPVVTDLSGLNLVLGHQVLPANNISFVQTIVGELAAKHYSVASMTLPPAASELDVKLVGQAYSIKFNLENNDPRQQVGTFLATITQLQSQHITPSQYIDVRVDGRAFYK